MRARLRFGVCVIAVLATAPLATAQWNWPTTRIVKGASLPGACTDGMVFFKTTATKGAYQCVDSAWASFSSGITGSLGATNNAVLRADGAGGATAQGSGLTVSDSASSNITLSAGSDALTLAGAQVRVGTPTTADATAQVLITQPSNTVPAVTLQNFAVSDGSTTGMLNLQASNGTLIGRIGYIGGLPGLYAPSNARGFTINGAAPYILTDTTAAFGTSGAGFLTLSAASNTVPVVSIPSVGLTTKPGLEISTTSGQTADAFRINGTSGAKVGDLIGLESVTLSTGGTTTNSATNLIPANAHIEAILARVTTTITTATDWSIAATSGIASCTNAWVAIGTTTTAQTGLTAGTTVVFMPAAGLQCHSSSATTITVTTTGTPGAGVIKFEPVYRQYTAPTS